MLYGITAAVAALLLTAVLCALLRFPALRLGLVERRRARVVPRLGGVAVMAGTGLVAGAGEWTGTFRLGSDAATLLVVALGVGTLGLVADLCALPLALRLTGLGIASALVVPYDRLDVGVGVLAVGWIVFGTLAFASLDHADGAMGVVAVVTAFALSGCASAAFADGLAALLSVLAAALAGFLMHNWCPARMVSGRCGALFTGFLLASGGVMVHAGREAGPGLGALFAPTAVAVADVALVLLASRRRGGHAAHRLRRLGLTPQGATLFLGLAAGACALVGLLLDLGHVSPRAPLWVAGGTLLAVLVLSRVPAGGAARPGRRGRPGRPYDTGRRPYETGRTGPYESRRLRPYESRRVRPPRGRGFRDVPPYDDGGTRGHRAPRPRPGGGTRTGKAPAA
ncbi:undecaprenyl/decaprenyl-phosphate alpha-N-acetylglucosaminyl 1-phosphate transferase [Streptomyces sp. NPDC008313]|uniref:undecaprenyl/decaprenyl-phosphate alpha-N-acetylglucosaminyl 1-phosphate transferase n=1 Tax=Streptomyces sp. NPDC008313 TaxID=3364826 RepID=UPI0036E7AEC7